MKNSLKLLLILTCALSLPLSLGCEPEESETEISESPDGDSSDWNGSGSTDWDSGSYDWESEGSFSFEVTDPGPWPQYRFVRIDDLSTRSLSSDGADIDAIILTKANGEVFYASAVEGLIYSDPQTDGYNPEEALGAPDAFYNAAMNDFSVCDIGETDARPFVSLGGEGGVLVVRMDANIEEGDTLTVLEVGGCDYGNGEAIVEEIGVSIAVSSDIDTGLWLELGSGQGPDVTFYIPLLDH